MKRIFAFILAVTMLFSLTACANEQSSENNGSSANDTANTTTDDTSSADTAPFDYSAMLDENGFFKGITAADYVILPEYKGISIPENVLTADEDEVQAQVQYFLEQSATAEQVLDRAVEDGDTVNIDYVGSIDGVAFEGGNTQGQGTDVTIGVTQYIDDFLEQLIGHKPGENFDIEVTFPEDYGKEELNGKDAVFNITINYIHGEKIIPELTDEFAQGYGYDSADGLRLAIELWVIDNQKEAFYNELIASAQCKELPSDILQHYTDSVVAEFEYFAAYYGTDTENFLALNGYSSMDDFLKASAGTIDSVSREYFVIQAIAEAENLSISDEYVTENADTAQLEAYGMPYMKQFYLADAVYNFIFDNAA